jgi:hypothetical protein
MIAPASAGSFGSTMALSGAVLTAVVVSTSAVDSASLLEPPPQPMMTMASSPRAAPWARILGRMSVLLPVRGRDGWSCRWPNRTEPG